MWNIMFITDKHHIYPAMTNLVKYWLAEIEISNGRIQCLSVTENI